MNSTPKSPKSSLIPLIIGFVIPTMILFVLSDESRLGPIPAMLLALAFPVGLELYNLMRRRKPSLVSLFAIIGIVLIGVITVLGLDEQWLAARRSILYLLAAGALVFVLRFRPKLVERGLERIIDMPAVQAEAKKKNVEARLTQHTIKVGYLFVGLLLIIAIIAYVSTLLFINSPAGSSGFNAEYARLRLLSLAFITLPLLVGVTVLLLYLANGFEKLTGIDAEQLLKRNAKT